MLPAAFGAAIYQINIFIGTILASLLPDGERLLPLLRRPDRRASPRGVRHRRGDGDAPELLGAGRAGTVRRAEADDRLLAPDHPLHHDPGDGRPDRRCGSRSSPSSSSGASSASKPPCSRRRPSSAYAVGLWAFSVIRIIVSAFYSLQDTQAPMKAAIVALIVNAVFSVALMFPLKHGGIALATSIATAVNVGMLWVILKRRIGNDPGPRVLPLRRPDLPRLARHVGGDPPDRPVYPLEHLRALQRKAHPPAPLRRRRRRRLLRRRPPFQEPGAHAPDRRRSGGASPGGERDKPIFSSNILTTAEKGI